MNIRKLNIQEINSIRAGEVVERPVSAIKELVENSIDAGATEIKISYSLGGKKFSIIDNGKGVAYDDMHLLLEKHATSKLLDINNIRTNGFRGEALASIAHVSNIKIVSRMRDNDAWSITNNNDIVPSSGEYGTAVYVSDMFDNFPARKAFLKSDSYESGLIKKEINEFSLIHYDICFDLKQANKSIFRLNRCKTYSERIEQIYGKEFIKNSFEIHGDIDNMVFTVFIPEPTYNCNNSIGQHIFVNSRHVKYPLIANALKAVYSGLSKNKNPDFICYIDTPYNEVNVNIHPNKREVRIFKEDVLSKYIYNTVLKVIGDKKISASVLKDKIEEISKPITTLTKADINLPLGKPIGIIKKNFVISETSNGMIMIDLHASHERMILQKLLTRSELIKSKIIEPYFISMNMEQRHIIETNEELFIDYGFNFVETDNGYYITRIPEYIEENKVDDCVLNIVKTLKENHFLDARKELITEICSELACHNAFRTGDEISLNEINMFLREMENTDFVAQCNHGRPTTIEMDIKDIEKLFGR